MGNFFCCCDDKDNEDYQIISTPVTPFQKTDFKYSIDSLYLSSDDEEEFNDMQIYFVNH